jgi:phage terminase large subunit-like protein
MGESFVEDGFTAMKISQNRYNYHEPIELLLDLVKRGKIRHNGDRVLRWAIDNLCVNTDATGRMMPDRKNSKEKIDPAVAMLMGLKLASLQKSRNGGSVFIS